MLRNPVAGVVSSLLLATLLRGTLLNFSDEYSFQKSIIFNLSVDYSAPYGVGHFWKTNLNLRHFYKNLTFYWLFGKISPSWIRNCLLGSIQINPDPGVCLSSAPTHAICFL